MKELRPFGRVLGASLALALVVSACADPGAGPEGPTDPDLGTALAPGGPAAPQAQDPFMAGQIVVRFNPGADAPGIAARQGASIQSAIGLGILVLNVPEGRELAVAQALSNNPNVEFAEPDWIRTFGDPAAIPVNDPYRGYKWDLHNDGGIYSSTGGFLKASGTPDADMDWLEAVQSVGSSSGSARIGIMDSGIRNDHVEFAGRIAAQYDFFKGNSNAEDDNGHGSHVAGIAAAATNDGTGVPGVAFTGNVTFAIAKVCGQIRGGPFGGYGCPSSAIANGITWAVDNGANVLNLSLGGGPADSATRSALQYARANNVLPICAAGNEAGPVSYPGAYPECVAVSATDWNDGLASYSNFGSQVELAAPGGDDEDPVDGFSYILSAYNSSSTGYVFMAGTSMASPQVAGLAALLHVLGVTDDDAKLSRMKSTADNLGPSNYFGSGRINVAAAVAGLGGGGPTPNNPPTAGFTYSCTDLSCEFTDASSDSDGSVVGWSWDFGGDGSSAAQNPTHTFSGAGTYTVSLTVTDDDGGSDSFSADVTVQDGSPPPPPPGGITLTVAPNKEKGRHAPLLTWSGASGTSVDIFRDGSPLVRTANDGSHTDNIGARGGATYVYRVCEAGTSTCSDNVSVVY